MRGPKKSLASELWFTTVVQWLFARNLTAQGGSQTAKVPLWHPELDHLSPNTGFLFLSCLSHVFLTPENVSTPNLDPLLHFRGLVMMGEYSSCMWVPPPHRV